MKSGFANPPTPGVEQGAGRLDQPWGPGFPCVPAAAWSLPSPSQLPREGDGGWEGARSHFSAVGVTEVPGGQ